MKMDQKIHLETKFVEEEDSSSSEDDENGVLLTEELEKKFLKVLSSLKKKDSNLYKESIDYFSSEDSKDSKQIENKQNYKEWLKGQIKKIEDSETKEKLEALHDFWTNPKIDKDEQFLRDYILNKKFLGYDESFSLENELQRLSEEEKEVEEQAIFEEKYNCRFEHPDTNFFQKYPQTMRKASGKKRNFDSLTETEGKEMDVSTQSPKKQLKKHNKSIEKSTVSCDTSFGKKRKHIESPDIKTKILEKDVSNMKDVQEQQQKNAKKQKKKLSVTENITAKNTEGIQISDDGKESVGKATKTKESQLKKLINNNKKKLENKVKSGKNLPGLKKMKEIFNLKDNKSRKNKKQKWHKKQNIKQPGALKKAEKKMKEGKRKPRHRSLHKLPPIIIKKELLQPKKK